METPEQNLEDHRYELLKATLLELSDEDRRHIASMLWEVRKGWDWETGLFPLTSLATELDPSLNHSGS